MSDELASLIRAAAWPQRRPGADPFTPATIRVVGPNPAVDRIEILDHLHVDAVNRSVGVLTRAGGKSLNLARAIRRLGLDVTVYGFLGGWTGTFIRDACATHGLTDRHITIAGETRISLVLVEPAAGLSTVINEPGPVVTAPEAAALLDRLAADCAAGDIAVLSGSLAPSLPVDFHAQMVRHGRAAGARVIVDTSGPALAAAVKARPWMVKPNLAEFAHLTGRDLRSDRPDAVLAEMRALVDAGVESVVVTLGQHGLLYADAERALQVHSPRVTAKNPTGSGDILLAGFVAARAAGADVVAALRIGVSAAAASCARIEPDIDGPADALALLPQALVDTALVDTALVDTALVDAAEAALPGTGRP